MKAKIGQAERWVFRPPGLAVVVELMRRPVLTEQERVEIHDSVQRCLTRYGQRYTDGRRAIIEVLLTLRRPVSITDIEDALPQLPRSSAYRHLADLQAASVVSRLAGTDDFARFELVEELTEHHHHLLCTYCGRVTDVVSPVELERTVTGYLKGLAKAEGFIAQSHRIDVFGLCSSCR
ncbi:MAG: transcriptional repressor [Actinobacteria bacterium]|jgi:Fe2+ or Zn2+ uptake regulation protein|nr:transcriptional repressor [Actinomycetota bacterium]